jgi:16S rRNA (guanine527-N7)-methyltransferase
MMPNASFSLIERMGKRCSFLANQKALLPLPNVDIQEKDIGSASGPFDLVAFRAFRPLEPPIVDQLLALISLSGRLAAWKGKRKNIEAELASIERYGLSAHIIETPVPAWMKNATSSCSRAESPSSAQPALRPCH